MSRDDGGLRTSLMLAVPDAQAAADWYQRAMGAIRLWDLGSVVGLDVEPGQPPTAGRGSMLRAYARTGVDPIAGGGGDDVDRVIDRVEADASKRQLAAALADLSPGDRIDVTPSDNQSQAAGIILVPTTSKRCSETATLMPTGRCSPSLRRPA